jgi:hypothetical protein
MCTPFLSPELRIYLSATANHAFTRKPKYCEYKLQKGEMLCFLPRRTVSCPWHFLVVFLSNPNDLRFIACSRYP